MGVVYHAIDPNIGRPLAIKTIYFGDTRKPEELDRMRERLFREARSAGMLSHPGIVTIYDVEQQGDIAYIAMEFVDGPTLDQVLSEPDVIPPERMFSILAQTAAALDYAHSKGIVHRDIKPANIMLAADGTSKITDFGIAKINTAEHLTMTGSIVGTPHYMSPEQVQGLHVDGRSDQFSLAVIAYEMLTGEKPYTGEHLTTVVYKIVAEEPVAPHRINPSLTGAIEGALRKAMAKKPDARYRTCQEFIETLEKASTASKGWRALPRGGLLHEPTSSDVPAPVAPTLAPPRRPRRTDAASSTATTTTRRKSGFLPFLLATLVAAGLLILIGWQAAPWMMPGAQTASHESQSVPPKDRQPAPIPVAPPVVPSPTTPSPEDAKPSPVGPPPEAAKPIEDPKPPEVTKPAEITKPAEATKPAEVKQSEEVSRPPAAVKRLPAAPAKVARDVVLQDVNVTSSPGGATASLDGNPNAICSTPCILKAAPGRHTLVISLAGYQMERHEFLVGTGPLELAPVFLRAVGGTLMLTSDPVGAAVSVNGKRINMLTPAQIPLAPGTYVITIEKDGRRSTQTIEIHDGINYSKIPLGQ